MLSVKVDSINVKSTAEDEKNSPPCGARGAVGTRCIPPKPPRMTGGKHTPYAARLLRHTMGARLSRADLEPGDCDCSELRSCRRGWKRLACFSCTLCRWAALRATCQHNWSTYDATSLTPRRPILSRSPPAPGNGDGCTWHQLRPRPRQSRRGRRRQNLRPSPSGRSSVRPRVLPALSLPS